MTSIKADKPIQNVLIVGGGAAGWISACVIAATAKKQDRDLTVTLVESNNIPLLGVGEGTWPSMRQTLLSIGISETDFLSYCDASFKQGSEFIDWTRAGHSYFHPFSLPQAYSSISLSPYCDFEQDFSKQVTPQPEICERFLAPKQQQMPDYAFALNYGYHLDAVKFAKLLQLHATTKLGVVHCYGDVSGVDVHEEAISAVSLEGGQRLTADFFIDCTGSKALLLGEALDTPLISVESILPNNRAIAVQVPYASSEDDIASVTKSTAQRVGWIWDIGLQSRRGIGQVYADGFISDAEAEQQLKAYVERTAPHVNFSELPKKYLKFTPGHREQFWKNNCVAIGMSAGFIEPLEASALALIEQSARFVAEKLPFNTTKLPIVAKRFNRKFLYHWSGIVDFLSLHYVLSQRNDSDYWMKMSDVASSSESLREALSLWEERLPSHDERPMIDELFPLASYLYVLLGMNFRSQSCKPLPHTEASKRAFSDVQSFKQQCLNRLPSNRALLTNIKSSSKSDAPIV